MKVENMSDPLTAGAAGAAGFKAMGGALGTIGFGAFFAAVVVMCMTLPKTGREWAVGLISTVIFSFGGGAYAAVRWNWGIDILNAVVSNDDVTLAFIFLQLFAVVFTCGLPGWAIVRAGFLWLERRKDKDAGQLYDEVKGKL
jgi:ABC-type Mn2+/Zn2+ transport system permease subunit